MHASLQMIVKDCERSLNCRQKGLSELRQTLSSKALHVRGSSLLQRFFALGRSSSSTWKKVIPAATEASSSSSSWSESMASRDEERRIASNTNKCIFPCLRVQEPMTEATVCRTLFAWIRTNWWLGSDLNKLMACKMFNSISWVSGHSRTMFTPR